MSSTASTSFASRATTSRSITANLATVNYGTVLSPGQSAVYPSSLYTSIARSPNSGNHLSGGALAGVIVGSIAGFLLILFLALLFYLNRRHKRRQKQRESQSALLPPSVPEMGQVRPNYGVTAAGVAIPAMAVGGVAADSKKPIKNGMRFGQFSRGHRREASAASTAPILTGPGTPSTARASADTSRFSVDSAYNSAIPVGESARAGRSPLSKPENGETL